METLSLSISPIDQLFLGRDTLPDSRNLISKEFSELKYQGSYFGIYNCLIVIVYQFLQFLFFYLVLLAISGTIFNIEKWYFKGSKYASLFIGMVVFALPLRYLNDTLYFNAISLIVDVSSDSMMG